MRSELDPMPTVKIAISSVAASSTARRIAAAGAHSEREVNPPAIIAVTARPVIAQLESETPEASEPPFASDAQPEVQSEMPALPSEPVAVGILAGAGIDEISIRRQSFCDFSTDTCAGACHENRFLVVVSRIRGVTAGR